MCGIWAVFGSDDDVSVQCHSAHTISHRGPDAFRIENINHFRNCCLGFHRLAIVDDMQGMQPMRLYTHPEIWLICNGQIYNHKMLTISYQLELTTHSDMEPMIHLYDKLGPEAMAGQLDGVFAFCILDTANRKVILGRDTFGVRPLFKLHTDNGFLAVCSEAKGLFGLSHSLLDEEARMEPFPPGHVEVYDLDHQGKAIFSRRTSFNKPGQVPLHKTLVSPDAGTTRQNIRNVFEAAVRKRLMSERRIGCLLSGGLDSSLVAALLVKTSKEMGLTYPIQTFSIGMEDSPDLKAARKVAQHLCTEHHEILFNAQEGYDVLPDVIKHLESYEVFTVRSSVVTYLLSSYIKRRTDSTVLLSGDGSDELTQGYLHFRGLPSAAEADRESRRLLRDLHMFDVLRIDRTTAAWGLEIRVPFLDHQFTSYYLSLPPEERQPKNGVEKHLLRSAFCDGHLLPNDILWRPKECLSDGVSTTQKTWRESLHEILDTQIDDAEIRTARSLYPDNTPITKEALFYRRIFEDMFPGKSSWVPHFWMPLALESGSRVT